MSLWLTYPLLLPSLIVGVTIVLWATSLLPEFITALLFFTAAMTARIAPPEVIFGGFASSAFWLVFSGFVLGVAIRKTGLADRAARALSAKLTDSWVLMVASVVLLSYALAFAGAFIWAAYCTVTSKFAKGQNGITLFVLLTALSLWVKYFLSDQPEMVFTLQVIVKLVMCGIALGFGYAAWNIGILHGNVTVLAAVSYFTPVLSAALAAAVLSSPLSFSFWQGALMVCAGSLLCWYATRQ